MADTKVSNMTDGTTLDLSDKLYALRTPFGAGDDRQITGQYIVDLLRAQGFDFGMMSCQAGASAEATVDGTWRKLTGWNTNGLSTAGVTPDASTDDDLETVRAGKYLVFAQISFTGFDAQVYDFEIYKNGSATGFASSVKLDGTGNVFIVGIVDCAATDTLEVYQKSDGSTPAITMTEAQFGCVKLGA